MKSSSLVSRISKAGLALLGLAVVVWAWIYRAEVPSTYHVPLSLAVAILAFVTVGIVVITRHSNRRVVSQLGNRKPMPPDEYYRAFFGEAGLPKEVVLKLLEQLGVALDVDPTLLRPDDRFKVELAPLMTSGLFDDGGAELTWLAEEREKKYGVTIDLGKIETLDAYIMTLGGIDAAHKTA